MHVIGAINIGMLLVSVFILSGWIDKLEQRIATLESKMNDIHPEVN